MGLGRFSLRYGAAAAVAAVVIGGLAGVMVFVMERSGFDPLSLSAADVERFVAGWGMWGALASMLLMVLHSFVPVPAEVIAVANGMMFGTLGGAAVTWSGAMLGALSSFALARWVG